MAIDVAAWYEKYGPMVIRRCRQILKNEDDAIEAVHDVFVNLIRGAERLHGTYPSSLLYTMATNISLNRIRKRKREITADLNDEDISLTVNDENYDRAEANLLLEIILKDESEMNRAICFMYHVDEMTLMEIGDAVGLSISGVRKRLEAFKKRARMKIG